MRAQLNTTLQNWVFALKPASWPKLLVPAWFGQALGVWASGEFHTGAFVLGLMFVVFDLAFIVLMNDWADQEVDTLKRQMFPHGCSPKTIPDGLLAAHQLGIAGAICGCLAIAVALLAELSLGRQGLTLFSVLCLLIFVSYSLPPLRLNYRGGGELLEMLGVGVLLPGFNAYLQSGASFLLHLGSISGFSLLALASALASGLSDEVSDRIGGKRTFTTLFGNRVTRITVESLVLLGAWIWLGFAIQSGDFFEFVVLIVPLVLLVWNWMAMRSVSSRALSGAFDALASYKRYLHRAIWQSTTVLGVIIVIRSGL